MHSTLRLLIPATEVLCESARTSSLSLCRRLISLQWKGYGDADNTYVHVTSWGRWLTSSSWEPFKSFEHSGEGIVDRFWERVDTKGRDVDSIEGWTNGEEVFPTGPPRMPSFIEHSYGHLLFIEAEGADHRLRKRSRRRQWSVLLRRVPRTMQRDRYRLLHRTAQTSGNEPPPAEAERVLDRHRGSDVCRTHRSVYIHFPSVAKCLTILQVPDSQSEGERMLVEPSPSSSPKLGASTTSQIPVARN